MKKILQAEVTQAGQLRRGKYAGSAKHCFHIQLQKHWSSLLKQEEETELKNGETPAKTGVLNLPATMIQALQIQFIKPVQNYRLSCTAALFFKEKKTTKN